MARAKKVASFQWALPKELELPPDPLVARLDFHVDAVVMTVYDGQKSTVKLVSASDIAQALSSELSVCSGLLPTDVLWWTNQRGGPVTAIWVPGRTRVLAIQRRALEAPDRYTIPVPDCVFICQAGRPPRVYAAKRRPVTPDDNLYKAPFFNVFADGRVCPGSHRFSARVTEIPEEFFSSFFTTEAAYGNRSVVYPQDLSARWETLKGQNSYPLDDLVLQCTVAAAMKGEQR